MDSEMLYVPRVTQLDAVELDKEILQILKAQLTNITKFNNIGLLAKWEPEIDAVLRFIIWKFSVKSSFSTFGQQLLSVKYGGPYNKMKVYMFAVLNIGSRYINDRSREIARTFGNNTAYDVILLTIHWINIAVDMATVLNLFRFLSQGKYPTLTDRLLDLQPVSTTSISRIPGYSFMTRQVLWHGFMELLGVTLPLVNFYYVRRKLLNLFMWRKSVKSEAAVFTVSTTCSVCREHPVLPHEIGCAHVFCFYCIQANYLADKEFQCPTCGFSPSSSDCIIPLKV